MGIQSGMRLIVLPLPYYTNFNNTLISLKNLKIMFEIVESSFFFVTESRDSNGT